LLKAYFFSPSSSSSEYGLRIVMKSERELHFLCPFPLAAHRQLTAGAKHDLVAFCKPRACLPVLDSIHHGAIQASEITHLPPSTCVARGRHRADETKHCMLLADKVGLTRID
jgi:hypothetical protein